MLCPHYVCMLASAHEVYAAEVHLPQVCQSQLAEQTSMNGQCDRVLNVFGFTWF